MVSCRLERDSRAYADVVALVFGEVVAENVKAHPLDDVDAEVAGKEELPMVVFIVDFADVAGVEAGVEDVEAEVKACAQKECDTIVVPVLVVGVGIPAVAGVASVD